MDNYDFCQQLIDRIQEPGFLIFINEEKLIVNNSLIKLLNYASVAEFYDKVTDFHHFFNTNNTGKPIKILDPACNQKPSSGLIHHIYKKNGTILKCKIHFDPFRFSSTETIKVWFGKVVPEKLPEDIPLDKSILNLFYNDKFLDEVLVITDFKGNVLISNREFVGIEFFADFSNKEINLFDILNESYHDKAFKRINDLKQGKTIPPIEYKLAGKDNKTAYVEIFSKPVTYKKKKAILSLIRDITTRKETEKKLLYTIVQTEEKERQRIARDLHDELGPFLSGLKLYLHELQANSNNKVKSNTLIKYLTEMIDEAVDKIRMIASNLTPQNMIDIGLTESVDLFVRKLNQSGQICIRFTTEGYESGIEPSFIITLYRIVLELINNSIKHAESREVNIRLIYGKKTIKLIYSDDGKGFDLDNQINLNKGIGLKSILNRIELYNGNYKFKRLKPKGIEFDLTFPAA